MCARFETVITIEKLAKRYGLSVIPKARVDKTEKRPTDDALIITQPGHTKFLKWGFHMDWSPKPLINARTETLLEKKSFQPTLNNRCLVPASAWFEWRKDGSGKHKNRISLKDQDLIEMAALHDGEKFCILTCNPHPDIAHIHSRMPVLLSDKLSSDWLDPSIQTHDLHQHLCAPKHARFDYLEDVPNTQQMSLF